MIKLEKCDCCEEYNLFIDIENTFHSSTHKSEQDAFDALMLVLDSIYKNKE